MVGTSEQRHKLAVALLFSFLETLSVWVWWYMSIIPALGRLRKEIGEFEVRLSSIVRPYLKKKKKTRAGRVAQVLEALSSNSSTTK
jgi:hypothetical protein